MAVQRKKHADLIQQLKTQLEDLESYAYESGEAIVPSNLLQERQKLVMGENENGETLADILQWSEMGGRLFLQSNCGIDLTST